MHVTSCSPGQLYDPFRTDRLKKNKHDMMHRIDNVLHFFLDICLRCYKIKVFVYKYFQHGSFYWLNYSGKCPSKAETIIC